MTTQQQDLALIKDTIDNILYLASKSKMSISDLCETIQNMSESFYKKIINLQPLNELEYE